MTSKGHTRGAGGGSYGGGSQEQEFGAAQSTPGMQSSPPRHMSSHSYLNTPLNLYRNSRSLDSGLDEFGAVPFTASPSPQSRVAHVPRSQAEVTQVQVNLVAEVIWDCLQAIVHNKKSNVPMLCVECVCRESLAWNANYLTTIS